MKIIIFVLCFIEIIFCQIQTYTFQWGKNIKATSIKDAGGPGNPWNEWFIEGPFGNGIDPNILYPQIERIGYPLSNPPNASWDVPINVLYMEIQENSKITKILFDTGLGLNISGGRSQLMPSLKSIGVSPLDINYIILTHGHGDHSGGLMNLDFTPAFPNATLVMGEDDWKLFTSADPNWDDFCCPSILNAIQPWVHQALKLYEKKLILINKNNQTNFTKIPNIYVTLGPGHTSGGDLIAYVTKDDESSLFVMGDAFVSGLHMENLNWGCTHDHHREEAIQTRSLITAMTPDSYTYYAMHFAFPGMGTFNHNNNTFTYVLPA